MSKHIKRKLIYNYSSDEDFMEAKVIGGNPNGIFNFNRCPQKWAQEIYRNMRDRTWFPQQVNISKDKVNYPKLDPKMKKSYDLVLAQLISNDSIQSSQLVERINCFITSPIVNACLIQQAAEEVVHADSYSVMAEDICQDTDRIYSMWKYDEELAIKNKAVADMYQMLYNSDDPTEEDLLLAFVANNCLENIVFLGGFAFFFSIEDMLPASSEMLSEISLSGMCCPAKLY